MAPSGKDNPSSSTTSLPLSNTLTTTSAQRPVTSVDADGVPTTQASSAGPPAGHLQRLVPESVVQAAVGQDDGQPGKSGPSVRQKIVPVEKDQAEGKSKMASVPERIILVSMSAKVRMAT